MADTETVEREEKQLRRALEGWREALAGLQWLLLWEAPWCPAALAGSVTACFLAAYIWEPTLLTLFALLGLLATLADFIVPRVSVRLVAAHAWSGAHERRFSAAVAAVAAGRRAVAGAAGRLRAARQDSPYVYFASVLGALVAVAWLGSAVNNTLLLYLTVLTAVLAPGLQKQPAVAAALRTAAACLGGGGQAKRE